MIVIQFELSYTDKKKNKHTVLLPSSRQALKERTRLKKEGYTVFSKKIITDHPERTRKSLVF